MGKGKAWANPHRSSEGDPNPDVHVSEFPMTYSDPDKGQEEAMRSLRTESKILIRDREGEGQTVSSEPSRTDPWVPGTYTAQDLAKVRRFLRKLLEQTLGFLVHAQPRTRMAAFLNLYSTFEASVVHGIQNV